MCGRFVDPDEEEIVNVFGVKWVSGHQAPSVNVCPTQTVRIVVEDGSQAEHKGTETQRELRLARWGLVPAWSKTIDNRYLLINARAETVTSKASFRGAAMRRRAIVPALGYYEWSMTPTGQKSPFFLHADDDAILGFAGLYEWWRVSAGVDLPGVVDGWLCSTTIITRPATDALGEIHDRMPVVVAHDLVDDWLSPQITERGDVDAMLDAMPDPVLTPSPGVDPYRLAKATTPSHLAKRRDSSLF